MTSPGKPSIDSEDPTASFFHQLPGRHPTIRNKLDAFNGTHQHEEAQPVGVNGRTR